MRINLEDIKIENGKSMKTKYVIHYLVIKKNAYTYLKKYTNLSDRKINNRIMNIF